MANSPAAPRLVLALEARAQDKRRRHLRLTGYGADALGLAQLGAWELGSGGGALALWLVNLYWLQAGVSKDPSTVFDSFRLGRQCINLYSPGYDRAQLDQSDEVLRANLGLDRALSAARLIDRVRFWGLVALSSAVRSGLWIASLFMRAQR